MVGKCLTDEERQEVAIFLLENSNKGVPKYGKILEAATKWGVTRKTVGMLWKRAKQQRIRGERLNVKTLRIGNTNKKRNMPDLEFIKTIDFCLRSTMVSLAFQVGVSVGLVHKWVSKGYLKPHSSALHPLLTEENKVERIRFALKHMSFDRATKQIKFKTMSLTIHMDEKWFFITRLSQKFYIVPGELVPHRESKSKRYITKVMFMCATSRPVYDDDGNLLFDGKIAMHPFTEQVPAQRGSKNRVAGTIETKAIDSITQEVTLDCLINNIIPAIKQKWPSFLSKNINIQQDNAKPHILNTDPRWRAAACSDGFNITLVNQPPNSPDLNTNDLGFFRALQSLQAKTPANNIDRLVSSVLQAFSEYTPYKLNFIYLSLQSVMVEILKANGGNNFSIPHMKKEMLLAQGLLPRDIVVDEELVRSSIDTLLGENMELEKAIGLEQLMEDLGVI